MLEDIIKLISTKSYEIFVLKMKINLNYQSKKVADKLINDRRVLKNEIKHLIKTKTRLLKLNNILNK